MLGHNGLDSISRILLFILVAIHSEDYHLSSQSYSIRPVPEETARVARAANPRGNPYMAFRDELDRGFKNDELVDILRPLDQASPSSLQLSLVTILQLRKNLTAYQAAEAVRSRITWKYLLGLELTDPGFDFSVLSEYRARLRHGSAEKSLLNQLVELCRPFGLLKTRGKQNVDTEYVLTKIARLNQ